MALKRLVENELVEDKLPYLDQYIMDNPEEAEVAVIVTSVVRRPKGFLIKTAKFIGFVFHNSQQGQFLAEALTAWYGRTTVSFPLFCVPDSDGKTILAVDDELKPSTWNKKGNEYTQSLGKKRTSSLKKEKVNPLLPSPQVKNGSTGDNETNSTELSTREEEEEAMTY